MVSPPTVGMPMQLPYPAIPRTTPSTKCFMRGAARSPNRSEFKDAIGRAPIVKMSRRIPPTPVAAPWYGSMKEGWLCDSILNATARPSPMSTTPAFSPGPCRHARPRGRKRLQVDAGGLVGAVLAPHGREDPELDQVGLAAEDLQDPLVLLRGEVVLLDELGGDHGADGAGGICRRRAINGSRGQTRRTRTSCGRPRCRAGSRCTGPGAASGRRRCRPCWRCPRSRRSLRSGLPSR